MKKRDAVIVWVLTISTISFIVGYAFGMIYQNYSVFSLIFVSSPCIITFIALYILSCIRRRDQAKKWNFGTPITRKTEDGSYELDPENLYEAVEKLGYFEHEL